MPATWRFAYHPDDALPPLAWLARVRGRQVDVVCGSSVRRGESGFFEGSWAGPPQIESVAESTTTFGTGIVVRVGELLIIPPAHTLAGVYAVHRGPELLVSNTLAGLLEAADLELLPHKNYVSRFFRLADGIGQTPIEIPTSDGAVEFHFYENLTVGADGRLNVLFKPRERPFTSYEDYVARLDAALGSVLANAAVYAPVVALSNGYDSTAVAVIAARHGCRLALTFAAGRPAVTDAHDLADSGVPTAERLGMRAQVFDRLAYLSRSDLPEAEFLASGYTGEDVAVAVMEPALRRTAFINGGVGAAMYRRGRAARNDLWRIDLSGCSMTDFRLRVDLIDVPLPVFGMAQNASLQAITDSAAMDPWSVGGHYDRPIARRIAEEGGIPRGTFAAVKHAATALIHQEGASAMAPASLASAKAFAAAEGARFELPRRLRLTNLERARLRVSHALHTDVLTRGLANRQRRIVHFEPRSGSLLLRWGVAQIRERYAGFRRGVTEAGGASIEGTK